MKNKRGAPVILCVAMLLTAAAGLGRSQALSEDVPHNGEVKGRVIDRDIKSPIPGVKVRLRETGEESLSDEQGSFSFTDVQVGSYSLEFSARFYARTLKTDVIVKSRRTVFVEIEMELDAGLNEEVTVSAGYYAAGDRQSVSTNRFSHEEIRRAAGAAGDVSRIISGLPSIARVNDMTNSLVVRGGHPAENAFYIDNIEIPNINHFPALGSTGGALGLLNVDFIRDVRFFSGGFSPAYGDRLSSVIDISFREGNREATDFQLDLSFMGFGLISEGPLPNKKGSWMLSVRKSYLDLLIDLMGQGVAPHYSDYQGKLVYELSERSRLTFLGVAGLDESGSEIGDALEEGEPTFGDYDSDAFTLGLNWFYMWGQAGYSNTSLSQSFTKYECFFFDTVSQELTAENNSSERFVTLRHVNNLKVGETHKLEFGFEAKHIETQYAYFLAPYTDVVGHALPAVERNYRVSAGKLAAFTNHTWRPVPLLSLSIGGRLDYFTYGRDVIFSPRLSLSLQLSTRLTLNSAGGVFAQQLPLILLYQNRDYRRLKIPMAYHAVTGFQYMLSDSTRLTVEGYLKEYRHSPLDPSQPQLFVSDELFTAGYFTEHSQLKDSGRARSYGIEVMVQKKLEDKFYGLISGSFFRARYQDQFGRWRNRRYDNRYILAAEGGYKPNRHWEFSIKWNIAGGAPFTPFDVAASRAVNSGIYDLTRINASRNIGYQSLNIRGDRRFHFRGSNLIVYLSVWNVTNHRNVLAHYWNTITQKPDRTYQWRILPAFGLEFEF